MPGLGDGVSGKQGVDGARSVALMFPGQGSQHDRMACGLYDWEGGFTEAIDAVFTAFGSEGQRLRALWLDGADAEVLDDVTVAQPLLLAVDYALGRMVLDWGVRPSAVIGHSVGEAVAAALAGVFRLEDLVEAIRLRMGTLTSPGGLLAVLGKVEDVRPHLRDGVVIGAVNSPEQLMLAGIEPALSQVGSSLAEHGFICRRARARQPFHSPVLLDDCLKSEGVLGSMPLQAPEIPLYSACLGRLLDEEHATNASWWARHPAEPVQFWSALDALLADHRAVLVEAGPGQGLSTIARRHPAVASGDSAVAALSPARPKAVEEQREIVADIRDRLTVQGSASAAPGGEHVGRMSADSGRTG